MLFTLPEKPDPSLPPKCDGSALLNDIPRAGLGERDAKV
jgi:hypothetical protein